VNTKDKNTNQKFTNNIESLSEHLKNKNNKNCSLTLPPPSQAILSNNIPKKSYHIIPCTIKEKSTPLFKTNGSITSVNNFVKVGKTNNDTTQNNNKNIEKNTIYKNKTNYMKNILNSMNYGSTTKLSKNNKKIYTKCIGILSGERARSISNARKRPKRIIYSSLLYNGSNRQLLNSKNVDMNKNSETRKSNMNSLRMDYKKNSEIIPILSNKDSKDGKKSKLKIKDLKLKGKHFNLQNLLNALPKKVRTKSTDK
jgi:hypothetical protein